ncbi:MAG TPA: hypothetical protein VM344_02330 [Vitreimonas sp.]|nr:hypothetical protein [Vitreimonas sp.]
MAKRTRGGRPGQRRPIVRSTGRPASSGSRSSEDAAAAPLRPTGALTPDEEARAAELEARIIAEERAAEASQRQVRERARTAELSGARMRDATPLHVKAATEYAYVRRDIIRILGMAAILAVILAILHILINVTGTIGV